MTTQGNIRKIRRKRFNYAVKRFDLHKLDDVEDWCSQRRGSVERIQAHLVQARRDLEYSVLRGEFGPSDRPAIFFIRLVPPVNRIGRCPLRLRGGQILSLTECDGSFVRAFVRHAFCAPNGLSRGTSFADLSGRPRPSEPARPVRYDKTTYAPRWGGGGKEREWLRTLEGLPSKQEADDWAGANSYSTADIRKLHKTLGKRGSPFAYFDGRFFGI